EAVSRPAPGAPLCRAAAGGGGGGAGANGGPRVAGGAAGRGVAAGSRQWHDPPMKAARLEAGTFHIREVPIPDPGTDEALVKLSAAGVCHSDLHLARGDWVGIPEIGSIGHEGIGAVEALGPGADRF